MVFDYVMGPLKISLFKNVNKNIFQRNNDGKKIYQ